MSYFCFIYFISRVLKIFKWYITFFYYKFYNFFDSFNINFSLLHPKFIIFSFNTSLHKPIFFIHLILICPCKIFITTKILPFLVKFVDYKWISIQVSKARITDIYFIKISLRISFLFLSFYFLEQVSIYLIKPSILILKIFITLRIQIFFNNYSTKGLLQRIFFTFFISKLNRLWYLPLPVKIYWRWLSYHVLYFGSLKTS